MKSRRAGRITITSSARLPMPPRRKLKRPDGTVVEEFVITAEHHFYAGKLIAHNNVVEGYYTGRICFCYPNGEMTRWYTEKSAPRWLQAMWEEATTTVAE